MYFLCVASQEVYVFDILCTCVCVWCVLRKCMCLIFYVLPVCSISGSVCVYVCVVCSQEVYVFDILCTSCV